MAKNLLFGSCQIAIADGQFILHWEQGNKRNVSLCEYIYTQNWFFKFKTYGKQNIEQFLDFAK